MVVIAIVVVLASLAITGYSRLKAHGDKVASMNNLRQLQAANQSFASDNNNTYVPAWAFDKEGRKMSNWQNNETFLRYYRGEVPAGAPQQVRVSVPPSLLDPIAYRSKARLYDKLEASYGYNVNALDGGKNNTPNSVRTNRLAKTKTPSRTSAFMTGTDMFLTYGGRFRWEGKDATEGKIGTQKTAYRHGGKALCVFFDGLMEAMSKGDIGQFDRKGGENHPFWKGF
jgi:hypothetical protein